MVIIGDKVRRDRPYACWHIVESIINDAAVSRCGRIMKPRDAAGRVLRAGIGDFGLEECQVCSS